jgi:peptidoglycan/xylan/chitin deacetylase (PgdA/CDA1 family)
MLMNWEEVRKMTHSGLVSFGSHTVSHALLDQMPLEKVRQELDECAARIQSETGMSSKLFAYPNGNYTSQVLSILSASGIIAAVTTSRGLVNSGSPLFELPRIAIHEDVAHTQALFQWRLFIK